MIVHGQAVTWTGGPRARVPRPSRPSPQLPKTPTRPNPPQLGTPTRHNHVPYGQAPAPFISPPIGSTSPKVLSRNSVRSAKFPISSCAMKLRVRFDNRPSETHRVEIEASANLTQLQAQIASAHNLGPNSLVLSLNKKDALQPPDCAATLSSLGFCGGDIVWVLTGSLRDSTPAAASPAAVVPNTEPSPSSTTVASDKASSPLQSGAIQPKGDAGTGKKAKCEPSDTPMAEDRGPSVVDKAMQVKMKVNFRPSLKRANLCYTTALTEPSTHPRPKPGPQRC
eukprot:gene7735-910_t